jgi:carbon-monoxide dehydrogenase large subunit
MTVGASIRRFEDPPLLRGVGRYVADLQFPQMLEALVIRSPHAHARISSIDVSQALRHSGVLAVFTAADLPRPVPEIPVRLSSAPELLWALQPVLATDRVRYVGEPVAVIVAESRYVAEDAADKVLIHYDALPAVLRVGDDSQGPDLHERVMHNVVYRRRTVKGNPSQAMMHAPRRLEITCRIQRHSGVPMETRGLVARPIDGRLEVYGPTKVVHFNWAVLARLLGWPQAKLRLIEPDVGGGFGIRGEFYPEDLLVPYVAWKMSRPVRWIEDRIEHLRSANHSREQEHRVQVGFSAQGRLLALRDEIWVDAGAYIRTHGVTVPELTQAMLPGPYDWPALDIVLNVGLTNKTPIGTYRGPGRFEGTFVRERVIEGIAAALKMDPAAVRRINLIPRTSMPYTNHITALGQEVVFDTADYPKALERALTMMNYAEFPDRCRRSLELGRPRGFGMAFFVEKSGLGPSEMGRCQLTDDGQFVCYTGLAALGQGTTTVLAQIVASALGIGAAQVVVVHGDTDQVASGHGSFASRGTVVGGSAAHEAARILRARICETASSILEGSVQDVVLGANGASIAGVPTRLVRYSEIAQQARQLGIELDVSRPYDAKHMTYPYGVHCAEVEVDPATGVVTIDRYGVVYDVGKAVNPAMVRGQIVGGVAQGLGGAILEELAYDDGGQLLAASFVDYLLPGASEVPEVEVWITEDAPATTNPLGVKGSGEGGVVGVAPAIANAVANALGAPPEAFCELPITSERVYRWIKQMEGHAAWQQ